MALIDVKHITKIFGKNPRTALKYVHEGMGKTELMEKHHHALGLHDINLSIESGEIFVIMGLSGSGKSTLIRHFNRLIDPTEGQIIVKGEDVTALSNTALRQFRRDTMSMVFQHFGLMPHHTVLDNAAYGLKIRGAAREKALQEGKEWLARVGLEGFERQYPKQLSGGQQQRVGLARALAANTDILLMDEAFSALDPLIRSQMQTQLLELQAQLKKTIVFITHDLSEALLLGNRIAILKDGNLSQIGTPEDILLNPSDDYVRDFVKDVDRASVLNISALMRRPSVYLENESLTNALSRLEAQSYPWAWVGKDGRYLGLVTAESLRQALTNTPTATLESLVYKPVSLGSHDSIQDAVPAAVNSDYPIPVIDAQGKLTGVVDPEKIGELYQEQNRSS